MILKNIVLFVCLQLLLVGQVGFAAARPGEQAPAFEAVASNGKTYKLSELKGKVVVLEWHNKDCPYVVKHYATGNMQKLQKQWTDKGVVWLSVLSSANGKQGYLTAAEENEHLKKSGASPTAALLDPKGTMGQSYGAKTTPHMFVIDKKGTLVYNGAIDDNSSSDHEAVSTATNYVSAAIGETLAGKPVTKALTKPYGCSVKYE